MSYNWHWFWDTGNGDIGNQGIHELDYARWGLNRSGNPKTVVSGGGKYIYKDDQETPNTQIALYDYGDCQLSFEVRGLPTGPGERNGAARKQFHRHSVLWRQRVHGGRRQRVQDLSWAINESRAKR